LKSLSERIEQLEITPEWLWSGLKNAYNILVDVKDHAAPIMLVSRLLEGQSGLLGLIAIASNQELKASTLFEQTEELVALKLLVPEIVDDLFWIRRRANRARHNVECCSLSAADAATAIDRLIRIAEWHFFENSNGPLLSKNSSRHFLDKQEASFKEQYIDWGEAPDITNYYERISDKKMVEDWILKDRSRQISILGLGGIGKTTFVTHLASTISEHFNRIIWRSMRNAPLPSDLIKDIIQAISLQQQNTLPDDIRHQLLILLDYLKEYRCLIILDNLESLLDSSNNLEYREEYEGYGDLMRVLIETNHNSCLIITSRDKPKNLRTRYDSNLFTRTLYLHGLENSICRQMIINKGIKADNASIDNLISIYSSNPLALKLVAELINDLFDGNLEAFVNENEILIGDVKALISSHFNSLSAYERQIIYWLAIEREPSSIPNLKSDMLLSSSSGQLLTSLKILLNRSMIERSGNGFTLQNVIMEYATEKLLETIVMTEFDYNNLDETYSSNRFIRLTDRVFHTHALMKANSKQYVRESQVRMILKPLAFRLVEKLGKDFVEHRLLKLIASLQVAGNSAPNYAAGNALNLLVFLGTDLTGINLSNLVIRQAYLQNAYLYDVDLRNAILSECVFKETFGSITSLVVSSNKLIVSAGNELLVFDFPSLVICFRKRIEFDWVRAVAISQNELFIATANEDHSVRIFSLHDASVIQKWNGNGRFFAVAFHPDSKHLIAGGDDNRLYLFSIDSKIVMLERDTNVEWIQAVCFSNSGDKIISVHRDGHVQVHHFPSLRELISRKLTQASIMSVVVSSNDLQVYVGCSDGKIYILSLDNLEQIRVWQAHDASVLTISLSACGLIVSTSEDHTVKIWLKESQNECRTLSGHSSPVTACSFSSCDDLIVTGSQDQSIRIWEVENGKSTRILRGYSTPLWGVVADSNSNILAVACEDECIDIWDSSSFLHLRSIRSASGAIWSVDFTPDGRILASGSSDKLVRLWNPFTGSHLCSLQSHSGWVRIVKFSPNGRLLVSGGEDNTVCIWDVEKMELCTKLVKHKHRVLSADFSPDGLILATAGGDAEILLWDTTSWQIIKVLSGHTDQIRTIRFAPKGNLLASGSSDRTIRIWDIQSGKCLKILNEHEHQILDLLFLHGEDALVSVGGDRSIRKWDLESYRCTLLRFGHNDQIRGIVYIESEGKYVTVSEDGSIGVWSKTLSDNPIYYRRKRPYEGLRISGIRGLSSGQMQTLISLGACST